MKTFKGFPLCSDGSLARFERFKKRAHRASVIRRVMQVNNYAKIWWKRN